MSDRAERFAIQAESGDTVPRAEEDFRRYINYGLEAQNIRPAWRPGDVTEETELERSRKRAKLADRCQRRKQRDGDSSHDSRRKIAAAEIAECGNVAEHLEWLGDAYDLPPSSPVRGGLLPHLQREEREDLEHIRGKGSGPSRYDRHYRNPCAVDASPALPWKPTQPFEIAPIRRAVFGIRAALQTYHPDIGRLSRRYVAACGRVRVADHVGIVAPVEGRLTYHGLATCGSVHECPTCQMRIKAARADEVRRVVEWHGIDRCALLTLTVRHGLGDDLRYLRRAIANAWRATTRGKPWKRFCRAVGLEGSIRALEVTHGPDNGFHPHLHVILLLRDGWQGTDVAGESVTEWLAHRWRIMVGRYVDEIRPRRKETRRRMVSLPAVFALRDLDKPKPHPKGAGGLRRRVVTPAELATPPANSIRTYTTAPDELEGEHVPDEIHGLDLRPCSAADYISKLGLEISDPGTKRALNGNRTPLQIAHDYTLELRRVQREALPGADGVASVAMVRDALIWRNYCCGIKGARQLTWSKDLKRRAGVMERSDMDLAVGEEDIDETRKVLTIPGPTWDAMRVRWVGGIPAPIWFLEQIEQHGEAGARAALRRLFRIGRPLVVASQTPRPRPQRKEQA